MPPSTLSRVRRPLTAALAVVALALVAWTLLGHGPISFGAAAPTLQGTLLQGQPAPALSLTDQTGAPVSLAALRGQVVTVSFLYTSCPDVCPVTASKLAAAYAALPAAAQPRVAMLAVTVDPARDTAGRRADFSAAQGLTTPPFHYLSGAGAALHAAWQAFHIGVSAPPATGGDYEVNHTSVTYVIDPQGRERVLLNDSDFTSDQLAADVQALLAQAQ